mmetsp:Transcript_12608/g.19039  ORF Transcript_12608/g.19039 Transcript_12608/m.19039 type:complete len:468 (+) Transcript_12608:170-1573(+)
MDLDAFVLTTEKKLKSNWTSHLLSNSITATEVDRIRSNFSKFDKKTKMKILISLIGVEKTRRSSFAAPIKRLLATASEDRDEWITVVAGLVHRQIFDSPDTEIESQLKSILADTVSSIQSGLPNTIQPSSLDYFHTFQPLEDTYLSPSVVETTPTDLYRNSHFCFTGKAPDFIARHHQQLEEKRAAETVRSTKPSLMPKSSVTSSPFGSKPVSTSMLRGMPSMKAALQQGTVAKRSVKVLSDSKIMELEKKRQHREVDTTMSKRSKSTKSSTSAEASGGGSQDSSISSSETTNEPPSSTTTNSDTQHKTSPEKKTTAVAPSDVIGDREDTQKSSTAENGSTDTAPPNSAIVSTNDISLPSALSDTENGTFVSSLLNEGVLLSTNDKQRIIDFFLHKVEYERSKTQNSKMDDGVAAPPREQKFKLCTKDMVNDKQQKIRATDSIVLTWDGTSHIWRKTRKKSKPIVNQ